MARKPKVKVEDIRRFREYNVNDISVIIRPLLTEKSMLLLQNENKATFVVKKEANALQIKEAVETIFNVKVDKVNTVNTRPHPRRLGQHTQIISGFKKAIVKLANGEAIDILKDLGK
jgi:large subunit ribosomal protein L23